jgi:hypothetical protein
MSEAAGGSKCRAEKVKGFSKRQITLYFERVNGLVIILHKH